MSLKITVHSAAYLLPRARPPNCRVKIAVDDKRYKTALVKKSSQPAWDELFIMNVPSADASFTIGLWHYSSPVPLTELLGQVVISAEEALGRSQPLRLDLYKPANSSIGSAITASLLITISRVTKDLAASNVLATANAVARPTDHRFSQLEATIPSSIAESVGEVGELLQKIFVKLDIFVKVVDEASKIHSIASLAWSMVSAMIKAVHGQLHRDDQIIKLLAAIDSAYDFAHTIHDMHDLTDVVEKTVDMVLKQTIECAGFIQEYYGTGFAKRTLKQTFDSRVQMKIVEFTDTFCDLHKAITTGVAIQATVVSYRVLDRIDVLARDKTLQKLRPAVFDASSRLPCLPETRISLLQEILMWALTATHEAPNVYWLRGLAGSGKSTVTTTLANTFRDLRRLGAFLFFDRAESERSSPLTVIRSLAAQLAAFDPRIAGHVAKAIEDIPSICEAPLSLQFTKLISEPLESLAATSGVPEGPVVVIIDGLDECGSTTSRSLLLCTISQFKHLPKWLRIVITSRSEVDIRNVLESLPNIRCRELDVSAPSNLSDITAFFRIRFSQIRAKRSSAFPSDWPGEEIIRALVLRAAGLFIWAFTACFFIDAHNPNNRLQTLLRNDTVSTPELALDRLYRTALEVAGDWGDSDFVSSFKEVMGAIIVSLEPLTTDVIDALLDLSPDTSSMYTIEHLGCVLYWGPNNPVRTIHPSFVDFLTDFGRCERTEWFVDTDDHHRRFALRCLDCMERYFPHLEVYTLEDWRYPEVPASTRYSCRSWIAHACVVKGQDQEFVVRILDFLKAHLLRWLESMTIIGEARRTIARLEQLLQWARLHSSDTFIALREFVEDAARFARGAAHIMEKHPHHIYHSALPFAPPASIIYQTFVSKIRGTRVEGASLSWPPALHVLSGHSARVYSISLSQDGMRIVSSSSDGTVRVWDANTGVEVTSPLRRPDTKPFSVAISPDGSMALVGYEDATVHMWDLDAGIAVLSKTIPHCQPFCCVNTVAFCPVGTRFLGAGGAFFQEDFEQLINPTTLDTPGLWGISVWDTGSEEHILLPGHLHPIDSAVFTHDGGRVVSASNDGSVTLWDLATRSKLAEFHPSIPYYIGPGFQFRGVFVVVSPDDRRCLASDKQGHVHVLDLNTMTLLSTLSDGSREASQTIVRPSLEKRRVASPTPLLYAPDGLTFLSARRDVIQVWDVASETIKAVYSGHTYSITSLAYSHRAKRIISGSNDHTICIWDAAISSPLSVDQHASPEKKYHMHIIQFSSDGKYILYVPDLISVCVRGVYDDTMISYCGHRDQQKSQVLKHLIVSIANSPDGLLVASASSDNVICIWSTLTGVDHLPSLRHPESQASDTPHSKYFFAVTFSMDQTRLVSGTHETVIIWDLDTGQQLFSYPQNPKLLQGTLLTSSDGLCFDESSDDSHSEIRKWYDPAARSEIHPILLRLANPQVPMSPLRQRVLLLEGDAEVVDDLSPKVIIHRSTRRVFARIPSWVQAKWVWDSYDGVVAFATVQGDLQVIHLSNFPRKIDGVDDSPLHVHIL
ncbi:hypothetical protein BXZ70DRAFT_946244 [Cristinia sonorae]|uniref:WD40 repeat-like protein n=1 Tax=Cristinia sonorae TaxID=1940300 RepID=A0A8K0UJH5_9AGAR|nr:hypothetical protein BXZ70DRAFT_946244 [Cristinia sonorae]